MIELSQQHLILLTVTSVLSGAVSAVSGGGGLLMLPALLITGLPAQMALGTNKLITLGGLFASSLVYIKQNVFEPKLWTAALIAGMTGALVGTTLALFLPSNLLTAILAFSLLVMSIYFLLPSSWANQNETTSNPAHHPGNNKGMSSLLGAYCGMIGPGTATIWLGVAMRQLKMPPVEAHAVSKVMTGACNLVSLLVFISLRQVDYTLGALLLIGGGIGAYLGARLCLAHGARLIRPAVVIITCSMAVKLILSILF